jgi:hypothetical protein
LGRTNLNTGKTFSICQNVRIIAGKHQVNSNLRRNNMPQFNIDIKGRIKNFPLKANQQNSHFPILEAIINSIQAIYEKIDNDQLEEYKGKIIIEFFREEDLLSGSEIKQKINKIIVSDNGIGFNNENYSAFLESDTCRKSNLGGKGVGRLSWLKAFKNVEVTSTYYESEKYYTRNFNFNLQCGEINEIITDGECASVGTKIVFTQPTNEFFNCFPTDIGTWTNKIIKHCLMYLFEESCPFITLVDNFESQLLNSIVTNNVTTIYKNESFTINGYKFNITHKRVAKNILDKHKLFIFGNNRCVKEIDLQKSLFDLQGIAFEGDCNYSCLLNSNYLDEHVDLNRLSFNFPKAEVEQESIDGIISLEKIIEETIRAIKDTLKDVLKPAREEREKIIKKFIQETAPKYGYLLKYKSEEIHNIAIGTDEKIDEQLYKIERNFEKEEIENRNYLKSQLNSGVITDTDYSNKFNACVERITEKNKSYLVSYIAHRRIIIDLFEQGMQRENNLGKYCREDYMHNLIYPMRKTSDSVMHDEQNLWLVDERLSYFFRAESDMHFNNDNAEKRPDIMLFDKPMVLVDNKNDGTPYDKIVIFELKRPMRDDLSYEEQNPIYQINEYKEKIEENNVKDSNGREIKVNEHTKFYLYVICDITEKFKKKLKGYLNLTETIDGLGFYRMSNNTYIEVLSYDKIINDAKKRNLILFEKLGIQ